MSLACHGLFFAFDFVELMARLARHLRVSRARLLFVPAWRFETSLCIACPAVITFHELNSFPSDLFKNHLIFTFPPNCFVLELKNGTVTCLYNGALLKKNLVRGPNSTFGPWTKFYGGFGEKSVKTCRGFGDRGPSCDTRNPVSQDGPWTKNHRKSQHIT